MNSLCTPRIKFYLIDCCRYDTAKCLVFVLHCFNIALKDSTFLCTALSYDTPVRAFRGFRGFRVFVLTLQVKGMSNENSDERGYRNLKRV